MAYEPPEMDIMLRKPRNAKRDRLVTDRFYFLLFYNNKVLSFSLWRQSKTPWFLNYDPNFSSGWGVRRLAIWEFAHPIKTPKADSYCDSWLRPEAAIDPRSMLISIRNQCFNYSLYKYKYTNFERNCRWKDD